MLFRARVVPAPGETKSNVKGGPEKSVGIKLHDLGNLACIRCILRVVYVSNFFKGACVCGFVYVCDSMCFICGSN